MRLVLDASTVVAEALRIRGRELLAHPSLDLVIAAEAWGETEHELRRRVGQMVARGILDATFASRVLNDALDTMDRRVHVAPPDAYAERMAEALRRIPQDHPDAPSVALALALDQGIWTDDRDFFGCGLPVWSTMTLRAYVEAHRSS